MRSIRSGHGASKVNLQQILFSGWSSGVWRRRGAGASAGASRTPETTTDLLPPLHIFPDLYWRTLDLYRVTIPPTPPDLAWPLHLHFRGRLIKLKRDPAAGEERRL